MSRSKLPIRLSRLDLPEDVPAEVLAYFGEGTRNETVFQESRSHYYYNRPMDDLLERLERLNHRGIPYTARYNDGEIIELSLRFSSRGNAEFTRVTAESLSIELITLEACLDDYTALSQLIRNRRASITPRSWDNQLEYGKVFLTKKLLNT